MTALAVGLLASLAALPQAPPEHGLRGTVRSSEGQRPVSYATVEVVGEAISDWTDDAGAYTLEGLPRGRWRIRVIHPNHDSLHLDIFAPGDRDIALDLTLRARPGPRVDALADFEPFEARYTLPALVNQEEVTALIRYQYPRELLAAGIGGEVVLWLWLDERGQVVRSQLSRSSGRPALDAAAIRVADRMRFRPAKSSQDAVRVIVQMPVIFVAPLPAPETAGPTRTVAAPGRGGSGP